MFSVFHPTFSTHGRAIPLEELLEAREQRVVLQQKFAKTHQQTVLSVTQLAVGSVKKNALLDTVFQRCLDFLYRYFNEHHIVPTETVIRPLETGNEAIFALPVDATAFKQAMIALEEQYPIARLWDLDVISPEGKLLSRSDFGFPPRLCLLCQENAKICARNRTHSADDIINEIQQRAIAEQIAQDVGELAYRALIEEAKLTPKPSLVDQTNSGSHRDMNLHTFEQSANALRPFWTEFVRQGITTANLDESQILAHIRPIGVKAEQAMLKATQGVNTHKGAIFAFGLVCTAVGRLWAKQQIEHLPEALVNDICQLVANMTKGITKELANSNQFALTAGIKLFQKYGLTGARGEAESGFPLIRHCFPLFLENMNIHSDWQQQGLILLLTLMAKNQDTNVVHRGGLEGLGFIQQQAKAILVDPDIAKKSTLLQRLEQFDLACIEKNLSAGGSADLLALTFFFYFLTLRGN